MTINDNSTKSINAAIIDLQNQIKQLQHKIGILSKNQLKEDDIEFPGKVEYADEAGKAKEADHAKTADTAKYTSETENAIHAGYADNATKAMQDGIGNVITDTYATKTELTNELNGKANTSHNHSAADITSGTLAIERGGTGQTTQADINKAFVGELPEGNDIVTDGTMFVSSWASDNGFADTNATNVPYKRKFSRVWEYIKGKISSVLDITNNKHIIKGVTVNTNTYEDANPKLVFSNSDGSQNASLTFTEYDEVQEPASLTLNGNQGGEYFIAPNIKATGKFYGNLDGTADNATKATQDGSGNVITDTYATKTELTSGLSGKADKSHTHTKSEIIDFDHTDDYGIYIPNPTYNGISYIIPKYTVQSIKEVSGVPVEGKTLQISFRLYKYVKSFSVQLSYGTTDAVIQQMSGVGRIWFVEIDQNDTDYFEDDSWKVFNKSVTIPQGNTVFGVGTNIDIGIQSITIA